MAKSTAPARFVAPYLLARIRLLLLRHRLLGMKQAISITTFPFRSVAPYLIALRLRISGMEHAVSTTTVFACRGASLVVALVLGMEMAVSSMTVLGRSGTTLVVAVWRDASFTTRIRTIQ